MKNATTEKLMSQEAMTVKETGTSTEVTVSTSNSNKTSDQKKSSRGKNSLLKEASMKEKKTRKSGKDSIKKAKEAPKRKRTKHEKMTPMVESEHSSTSLLLDCIADRIRILNKALKVAKKTGKSKTQGRIRISKNRDYYRYYLVTDSKNTTGTYIPKKDYPMVTELVQQEYSEKFINDAEKELKILNRCYAVLSTKSADHSYLNLSQGRKDIIIPYIESPEAYAKKWQEKSFSTNDLYSERLIYETSRGELVRSKSEAILADMFYELGIPYHYEKPLTLKGGKVRYPDFTLLKVSTKEEFYFEHFGLMGNSEYVNENLEKLNEYRDNGIYPGKNLLFSYESEVCPLDIQGIRNMLKDIFD